MFQTMNSMRLVASLIGSSLSITVAAEDIQNQQDPDWPCPQILVPEVPAAVVWAGPSIAEMEWLQDKEVASLVNQFASPDYDLDLADGMIADYVAKRAQSDKNHKLTLLFSGVIQTMNEQRKKELDNIIKYARGQAARANRLSEELDEMVRLQDDSSQAAKERLAIMQQELELKQRMFDDREMFIQHLCTRPVVTEQKLGSLARTIAYYLD